MSDQGVDADPAASHDCSITADPALLEGPAQRDIVSEISASALSWQTSPDVFSLLTQIVASAVRVFPWCNGAALVTLVPSVGLVARASLGPAEALIDRENSLGDGPNWHVLRELVPVIVELPTEARWQPLTELATTVGITSLSCHPLVVGKDQWGSLLLLSQTPDTLAHSKVSTSMFAAQAAIAVNTFQRLANMQERLLARESIERAKGILMARRSVSAEMAFGILRRQSQDENIKLRVVSENLCRSMTVSAESNCEHLG